MKILFKKNFKEGMTLIETMFYLSLFIVMFSILFTSLNIFYSNKIKNKTILEVEQQGFIASTIISQEIRNAQSINSPSVGGTSDALSLEHFDALKNPLIISLVSNQININEGGESNYLNSSLVNISNLSFTNNSIVDGNQSISFSFDVDYNSDSNRQEYKYSKSFFGTVNLRKK